MAETSKSESKAPSRRQQSDPTIRTLRGAAPEYPEGTHEIAPLEEQDFGPHRFEYKDMPDDQKPDPSTVAQVVEHNTPGE